MKTIHKFHLSLADTVIRIDPDFMPLRIAEQSGRPYLWALVNDDVLLEDVKVQCFATGEELPRDMSQHIYLGSWDDTLAPCGPYVWHFFVRPQ